MQGEVPLFISLNVGHVSYFSVRRRSSFNIFPYCFIFSFTCHFSVCFSLQHLAVLRCGDVARDASAENWKWQQHSSIQLHTAPIRNPSLNLWQVTERKALSRISLWGPEVSYLLNTETSGPHNATTSSPRGTVPNPLSFWVYNDFIMA